MDEEYNASVERLDRIHEDLMVLVVRPDGGRIPHEPGQYTTLGLGTWEPRVAGCQAEDPAPPGGQAGPVLRLVRRAYSFSSPLVDDEGALLPPAREKLHEFYVSLVREGPRPPALTPRLFALGEGSRLFIGTEAHGHFTLEGVRPDQDVVFAATGVGEAPHNAMLAALLSRGHQGRIATTTCVRHRSDLAYLERHRRLEERFPRYRYLPLTTREPENLDPETPGYVGKRYLQDFFASGAFEAAAGWELDPARAHVYLCGNPDMIGVPHHTHDPDRRYPEPVGMVEILEKRGFRVHRPHREGTLHFEKYW